MIRVLIYLVIVALLAFGAVWLAERPGDVVITWQGERVETSVMVLMAAAAAVAVAAVLLWSIARAIVRSPDAVSRFLRNRRGVRAYQAVSHGLIAVGSGDARAARKFTAEARRIAPSEPLTLLLSAQAAQLAGDRDAAAATFQQMAGRDDTKVLGLHGLFVEAQRRNDPAAALFYAEEAAKQAAVPPWAGQAVLEFRCVAGDWSGALDAARAQHEERADRQDRLPAPARRAAHRAGARRRGRRSPPTPGQPDAGRERAQALALEAVKLAPDLVPAAALAGRLLGAAGEKRKATRIIEAAWRANPHPDLADAFAHLQPGDSARERLARVESLAGKAHRRRRGRDRGGARRARRQGICGRARGAGAAARDADAARGGADGRARAAGGRRGPRPRMDGAHAQRAPRSGLDRRRPRVRSLAAGLARHRPARRLRVARPARRRRPHRRHHRRRAARLARRPARAAGAAARRAAAGVGHADAVAPAPAGPSLCTRAGREQIRRRLPGIGVDPRPSTSASDSADVDEESERAEPSSPRGDSDEPRPPPVIALAQVPDDPGPESEPPPEEPAVEPGSVAPPDGWSRFRARFR